MSTYEYALARAKEAASESFDPSTKVGAVLQVFGGPRIVGHNTFPGIDEDQVANASRDERMEDVIHAEEVVLMRAGTRAAGATVVSTHEPCGRCWRRLSYAGVSEVVFPTTDPERRERWGCEGGRRVAKEWGVKITEMPA